MRKWRPSGRNRGQTNALCSAFHGNVSTRVASPPVSGTRTTEPLFNGKRMVPFAQVPPPVRFRAHPVCVGQHDGSSSRNGNALELPLCEERD